MIDEFVFGKNLTLITFFNKARGSAAMVIEALSLYYHINCFRCSICHVEIGKLIDLSKYLGP